MLAEKDGTRDSGIAISTPAARGLALPAMPDGANMMDNKNGCGMAGCLLPLLLALIALGYFVYKNQSIEVVYNRDETTQDTITHYRQQHRAGDDFRH